MEYPHCDEQSVCFIATAVHSFVLLAQDDMECAHRDDQRLCFVTTAIPSFALLAQDDRERAHRYDQSAFVSSPLPFMAEGRMTPAPTASLVTDASCLKQWNSNQNTETATKTLKQWNSNQNTETATKTVKQQPKHWNSETATKTLKQWNSNQNTETATKTLKQQPKHWNSETATKTLKQQLKHWNSNQNTETATKTLKQQPKHWNNWNSTKQQLKHWESFWKSETVTETVKVIGEFQLCLTVTCPFVWRLTSPALSYCNLSLCVTIDKPTLPQQRSPTCSSSRELMWSFDKTRCKTSSTSICIAISCSTRAPPKNNNNTHLQWNQCQCVHSL